MLDLTVKDFETLLTGTIAYILRSPVESRKGVWTLVLFG